MKNKVSRIAIICALEETIRDEVKRMCDTDSLAELDTMALHAKGNIKMLQSVKYKSLVNESVEVVKDLVKDEPQTDCQDCKYAWWNGDAKRYECTVERCQYEDEPQTCSVSGRPYSECASDEPQKIMEKCYKCKWWNYSYGCSNKKGICEFEPLKDEPQTAKVIGCSKCSDRFWCIDRDMPHAVHCNNYGKSKDEQSGKE